jgi:phosphoribosylaminoimidazole-succinocarboxamide synthase
VPAEPPLLKSAIDGLPVRRGKVRDVYDLGDALLLVATDRLSAFDVVLPTGIPDKGRVLTQLSNFWFAALAAGTLGIAPVRIHLIETDVTRFPESLAPYRSMLSGRAVIVQKTNVVPIECVVRGHLAGGGWKEYQAGGAICGVRLPAGLRLAERLPEPIFTPTTKAERGHDESISFDAAAAQVGRELLAKIREQSLAIYRAAAAFALQRGVIIADTKFEWGVSPDSGALVLIDEVLTPDSSRFWPADAVQVGHEPPSFDKQFVRNYLETLDWNKTAPGPALPPEVVAATRQRYVDAYERLTGQLFT